MEPFTAKTSSWVRAPESGMLRQTLALGRQVAKGDLLGIVCDPYSSYQVPVKSPFTGIVVGRSESPVAHEGDALFHIARFRDDVDEVEGSVDSFQQAHLEEGLYDD